MSGFFDRMVSTFFFTGHFPVAPATFTSLITIVIWYFLPPLPVAATIGLLCLLAVVGTWAANRSEQHYGHDAKPIVIDEVLGMWLTVAFLGHGFWLGVIGFVLFRILDVVKPPPAYQLQSLRGGYGIMADDVMAGIYGNVLLGIALRLWPALRS